jgi:hypothetical protein
MYQQGNSQQGASNYGNGGTIKNFKNGGAMGKRKLAFGEDKADANRKMKAQEDEFKAIMFDNGLLEKSLIKVFK